MSSVIGTGEWLRLLGSLALVLALLVCGLWAYRWLAQQTQAGFKKWTRLMVIRESLTLGMRQRLLLVEVDGHRVMVGVSPSGITRLAEWPLGESGVQAEESDEAR